MPIELETISELSMKLTERMNVVTVPDPLRPLIATSNRWWSPESPTETVLILAPEVVTPTSPEVKPLTGSLNWATKCKVPPPVGSGWSLAWSIVTVGGTWSCAGFGFAALASRVETVAV